MRKSASFSEDRVYRYTLTRIWDSPRSVVAFVGLNPSTADESEDDPTVRRCIGFAKDWGYGGMMVLNAFAFRATDPTVMKAYPKPIGPENDEVIGYWSERVRLVVACWGTHGAHLDRGRDVRELITGPKLRTFGFSKNGHPVHPLYLARTRRLVEWHG